MKIAVAADSPDPESTIAGHSARAPFYLLFSETGELLEVVSNPFSDIERGAAQRVARMLADREVALLAAREFGSRFVSELESRGIDPIQRSGQISVVARQLSV